MARNWRALRQTFCLCGDQFRPKRDFWRAVSVPRNRRSRRPHRKMRIIWTNADLETEHQPLARPLCGQVTHPRHAMAVREAPFDCGLDEVGREEGKRDRHVDLPCAAALAHCDTLGFDSRVGHDLIEPAATLRNRCNQQRAVLGADRAGILNSAMAACTKAVTSSF